MLYVGNGASLAGPTATLSLTQPLAGVTAAAFTASAAMKSAFQTAVATAAGVAPSAVTITGNTRRTLLQSTSTTVAYTVTTANPSATTSSLTTALTSATTATAIASALTTAAGSTVTASAASATAPTSSPVAAPTSSSSSCFAATELLTLESGATRPISEVAVGDSVLTVNPQGALVYSPVVYLPHAKNDLPMVFVQVTTQSGRDLKMTLNHFLPAGACAAHTLPMTTAGKVAVGDCVQTVSGREQVMSVGKVEGRGVYTAVAMEELIVVNGIVATPFGGVNPTLVGVFYNAHRLLYAVGCGSAVAQSAVQSAMLLWARMASV